MAQEQIIYCNTSMGRIVELVYDTNDPLTIQFVGLLGICGYEDREVLFEYQQPGSPFKYVVKPQNTHPYAYVLEEEVFECLLTIDNIQATKATDQETADGVAVISYTNDTGGTVIFSLDGVNWQLSNVFEGLRSGNYRVYIRSTENVECQVYEDFTVGYEVVPCDLKLGTIKITAATDSQADGSITVETLQNARLSVEYRLDAGLWQDSPIFLGLAASTYNVQVRYKTQPECVDSRNVTAGAVSCDIKIEAAQVTHEQQLFENDGSINVIASSSSGPIEYSKDDGATYQASSQFFNLPPGDYNIRVKDAVNCEDVLTVTVKRYRKAHIDIPIVQTHRFVLDNTDPQNFDNRLFKDMKFPGVIPECYYQKMQHDEPTYVQFRSNYESNTLKIYDLQGVLQDTLNPLKKTAYTKYTDELTAYITPAAAAGKAQVYFNEGLPEFAQEGQLITLSDFAQVALNGDYLIEELVPGELEAEGFEVMIISAAPNAGVQSGMVSAIYDLETYEVYEQIINWAAYAAGQYYIVLEGTDEQFASYRAQSEPVDLKAVHDETILIRYKNLENAYKIDYTTGIIHHIRVEGEFKWPTPGGDRTVTEDSRKRAVKLAENVTRNLTLRAVDIPPYLAEKIALAFGHDYIEVNGVEYQTEEDVEIEYLENEAMVTAQAQLRQVIFIADNSDDQGDVDTPVYILGLNNDLFEVDPA